jgi:beta-galactosidase
MIANHTNGLPRRDFLRTCVLGGAVLASAPLLGCRSVPKSGPAKRTLRLDRDWLFGGRFTEGAQGAGFNDAAFARITLPHCVSPLSWQKWDPAQWEDRWIYRRHFALPVEFRQLRVFLHFDGVMVDATPMVNGRALPEHHGGYLPFDYEITDEITTGENVLAVVVDSRWLNVPPAGSPKGSRAVDYMLPGGIHRPVSVRAVPQVFIRDVFAKPVRVLEPDRRVELRCTLDAAVLPQWPLRLEAAMLDGGRPIVRVAQDVTLKQTGETEVTLTLDRLGNVAFWDVDAPRLYEIVVTLFADGQPRHDYRTRIGLRDARFELEGFFLNGRRLQLFGLNRHELFPFVGYAMPARVQRRDAQTLRREFNCNIVRCSHYPQSAAFLDACDELGLLVWEEVPGWGYLGDAAWKELLLRDVRDTIVRDRNRPSIVIWGTRANESANDVELYGRSKALAKSLDDSRPTSGSMTSGSRGNWRQDWHEDVFAFDDYHSAPDGSVGIEGPTPGVPYLLTETVGQFNYSAGKGFDNKYRRAGDVTLQQQQALRHAQAHSKAAANPRICGAIAWCAFDYASPINSFDGVKCPGVADVFRVPKLGASFYLAQGDPKTRPVIEPNFYWDFGPQTPTGPGEHAAIFSNCDRLELSVNGKHHATLEPDRANFPQLKHPPFFANLALDGARQPELRIDGYLASERVLSRSFSSDPAKDQLWLHADDDELISDGSDATRLVFRVTDKYGAPRPFAGGQVSLRLEGPGVIVGDNPFQLADSGGVGAVWIKTLPGGAGTLNVIARHSSLGERSMSIAVRPSRTAA